MRKTIKNNFNSKDFEIDGTVLVEYKGKGTDVVIPNFITEIATCVGRYGECYSAFNSCLRTGESIRSITVPKSLAHIDGWTFYVCDNLEHITVDEQNEAYYSEGNCIVEKSSKTLVTACKNSVIQQDIKQIADHALVNCGNDAYLTYNGTKRQWSDIDKHADWDEGGRDCVVHCVDGDFTVDDAPFRIKGICLWSYRGHSAKVVIPNGITRVLADSYEGNYCFEYCDFVKSISVPKSLDKLDGISFYGCFDLEEIIVDSQNPKYYSQGNCITERASKKLVVGCKTSVIPNDVEIIGFNAFYGCKNLTDIAIPSSVTSIESGAFCGCGSLTGIKIPNGVKTIADYTFCDCSSLNYLIIPNSVTSVGDYVFKGCNNLTSLFYKGAPEEFNKISVGHDNAPILSVTVYFYSHTAPATEGNYWHYGIDGVTPVVW